MPKVNKQGSQKPVGDTGTSKTGEPKKPGDNSAPIRLADDAGASSSAQARRKEKRSPIQQETKQSPANVQITVDKGKQTGKNRKPVVGGTAVPGSKSTQPREIKTATPAEQQAENYNREMRRRMHHMGTGPYGESPANALRDKRQKRLDKRKQRQEEVKKAVVSKGPSTNIKLGRRNTYFLLGIAAILVVIIVLAIIIRHPF